MSESYGRVTTVGELISVLSELNPDDPIVIALATESGDDTSPSYTTSHIPIDTVNNFKDSTPIELWCVLEDAERVR